MSIDMHSHWFPKTVIEALRARSIPPLIERTDDGADLLRITRGAIRLESDHSDLDDRLAIMDRNGIDKAVFSIPGAGIDNIPVEEAVPLARLFNDGLIEACSLHPDRFVGFATLPCDDISAALEEFERVITKPGVIGALLPGSRFFSLGDAEPMAPLFEAAQRHRAPPQRIARIRALIGVTERSLRCVAASATPCERRLSASVSAQLSGLRLSFGPNDPVHHAFPASAPEVPLWQPQGTS